MSLNPNKPEDQVLVSQLAIYIRENRVALNTLVPGIKLLGTALIEVGNDVQGAKQTVYTVSVDKKAVITHTVFRSPSGTLVGATDIDIGSGALCTTWRQTISLATMTIPTDYMVIPSITVTPVRYTLEPAEATVGIYVNTGSTTAGRTVTMDIFGYEV